MQCFRQCGQAHSRALLPRRLHGRDRHPQRCRLLHDRGATRRRAGPDNLPTFALVTPNLCDDGHDCPNSKVDDWAHVHIAAILSGDDYRAGSTAVFVVWDETHPVPNLLIAPSAEPGPRGGAGSHAAALKTIEEMLGLPVLAQGQLRTAPDLRESAPRRSRVEARIQLQNAPCRVEGQ